MSKASLLINDEIWRTLPEIIKASRHVDAAIAYFWHDGARLFPLKRGDCLVVDMSPATVKAGSTNPNEIEKLIKRGVQVFTRRNLHAKIVIADKKVKGYALDSCTYYILWFTESFYLHVLWLQESSA